MKSNEALQRDVQDAIKWEPLLQAAEIGVIVKDSIVTLSGSVDNFAKKKEAEHAAKSVHGVKAVVENIEVKFADWLGAKTDTEIAVEILHAYKINTQIPEDKIKIQIEGGWVILEGELQSGFLKELAKEAISHLPGVKGVKNNITIQSEIYDPVDRGEIESALRRNWSIDNTDIEVKVAGSKVTLKGKVESLYQKDEAEKIAWNAPGVRVVNNDLVIDDY